MQGFTASSSARTQADIDEAADKIAKAVSLVGIDMIATVLFRWKRPHVPNPLPGDFPRAPATNSGSWRYRPKDYAYPFEGKTAGWYGYTDFYGDIHVNTNYALPEQLVTFYHEQVHQLLAPKLDILRRLRAKWSSSSYNNSYLRRFLEEALCEVSAQVRVNGLKFGAIVEGFRFPFTNGYDIAGTKLAQEIGEMFLGPIKVDDVIYNIGLVKENDAPAPRISAFGRDDLRPSDFQGGFIRLP